jgi:N12 class adenine-specific DNA methylase
MDAENAMEAAIIRATENYLDMAKDDETLRKMLSQKDRETVAEWEYAAAFVGSISEEPDAEVTEGTLEDGGSVEPAGEEGGRQDETELEGPGSEDPGIGETGGEEPTTRVTAFNDKSEFRKIWDSAEFKAFHRLDKGKGVGVHRESPVAAEMVRGWIDGKAKNAIPADEKKPFTPVHATAFNPLNFYLMAYWYAQRGTYRKVSSSLAPSVAAELEGVSTPTAEPGADSKPQLVIPGAEPDIKGAIQNAAKAPLKPKVAQKPADDGLFGDGAQQPELFGKPAEKKPEAIKSGSRKLADHGEDINGYGDSERNDNPRKTAFLKDAKGFLDEVSKALKDRGFTVYDDRKGKPMKAVIVNEGGTAGSGDVHLNMRNPDLNMGVSVKIGESAISRGVTFMYRTEPYDTPYGGVRSGHNEFAAHSKFSVSELADKLADMAERRSTHEKLAAAPKPEQTPEKKPEPAPKAEAPKPAEKPKDYGSANTLVTKDRAAELREKLKAKLKGQLSAGIDPEMLAMGTELAAFHIEAGARKFADFAKAIASDLGVSIAQIRPYLRSWYNGSRDMLEDAGLDIEGMDTPDQVKAALAELDKETADEPNSGLREPTPPVPTGGEPGPVQEPDAGGNTGRPLQDDRPPSSGNVRKPVKPDADSDNAAEGLSGEGIGTGSNPANGGRDRPKRTRPAAKPDPVDQEIADLEAERAKRRALNYRIMPEDRIGQGGPKEKVTTNIEAIRTLKKILEEKREATPDEKKTLVRYVGWGAFAQDVFAKHKPEWQKERAALADLLTAEEFASARASTLNAHYTSESVIKGMWQAMEHLGFKGGRALEPSSGVGHFIGLIPDKLAARTDWSAVDLDTVTGNIAKLLYTGSDVNVMGFEKFNRPQNFYDVAISNVPFGDFRINDPKRPGYLIHDYFFIKGLDLVRPGGLVAFITSSGTMDKQSTEARKEISKRADFVGAIRLPGGRKGAFAGNAGTEVTTDIIFLRKRGPGMVALPDAPAWMGLKSITTPEGETEINEYFAANPQMMLGEMRLMGSMYRADSPVLVGDAENIEQKIAAAAAKMPGDIMLERSTAIKVKDTKTIDATSGGKEGGYFQKDGKIYRKVEGVGVPQNFAGPDAEKINGLIAIRDVVNELLANQAKGDSANNDKLRTQLNKVYDAFVKKHGPINLETVTTTNRVTRSGDFVVITKRPNFSKFSLDPDAFKVAAIENYDADSKKASKAAIFTADILGPAPLPNIASASDTIGWSLNMFGRLSIPQMSSLYGKTEGQLIRELGDLIYENPTSSDWEPRDQYLAGDVVTKLEEAQGAAESDPKFKRNVEALEKVQPEPLTRDDIRVPFGAPWVPADIYSSFFRDELDSDLKLTLNPVTKRWGIKSSRFSRTAETKYATERVPVDQIIKNALDQTPVRVMDKGQDDKLVFNAEATEQAQARVNALREAFAGSSDGAVPGWIWNDDERSVRLEAIYNKQYNRLVAQKFDGSHLNFPGLTATITDGGGQKVPFSLRPHQKNAVARIIQNGNTLLAHVVGAGKTFTMIAAGMEQRRLGQKQRPTFIVPNHMLEQFSREFLQAYPGANILVAQKEEMTRDNRKAFAAKIAAQKWDGIIITHDAFGRIRMSQEAYKEFTEAEIESAIRAKNAAAEEEGKKSPTVKDLEKLIKRLETKLANLIKEERKDEGVTFEELGIDQLYLDEAHLFKNLSFFTRHTRIKGIGGTASQRSTDLFMKIHHLEKSYPGRSTVFATGTPVSNTMAEMYTMQRYLQLGTLKDYGVDEFDAWAATFGEVRSQMELGPDGRTLRETTSFSRFINIPELYAMYSRVADSQTADMLNLPRPKRKGGKAQIIEAEFSEAEEAAAMAIVTRAVNLKGKKAEKGADNMLKVVTDGRKLATDARLLDPNMPFNPKGKTAKLVANIFDRWKGAEFPAIAQLVFLDMGVPQSKKAATKVVQATEDEDFSTDDDAEEVESLLQGRIDLYSDVRDRLVSRGIPREQIAFIHEANDDTKKARLFGKVRSGEVRVLIGSTGKMGVGTNVQRLLRAIHHDDAPWKPAEVEQRDGRIERQGNLNPEIEILRYITKKSMDAFMWQTLERKAQFIGQLLSGAKGLRHAEDVDSPLPEAADMKAAATGDPRIMEQAELTKRERELKVGKSSHDRIITEARRGVSSTEARITYLTEQSTMMARDAAKVKPTAGDAFKIDLELRGRRYTMTERKAAGEAIRRFGLDTGRTVWGPPRPHDIGTISDLAVQMVLKQSDDGVEYAFAIQGETQYGQPAFSVLTEDADPIGMVRRIENVLSDVPRMANYTAEELDRAKVTLTKMNAAATDKPFPRQKELDETSARLKALNAEFKSESEKKPPPATPEVQGNTGLTPGKLPPTTFVATKAQVKALNAKVQAEARRMFGHGLRVEVVTKMPSYVPKDFIAAYNPSERAVWMTMRAAHDWAFNLGHEGLHHLRFTGAITDAEFRILFEAAKEQNPEGLSDARIEIYRREYKGKYGLTEAQFIDKIEEEAAADLVGDYVKGRTIKSSKAAAILKKIKDFIEAMFRLMEGQGWPMPSKMEAADRILSDIYEGKRADKGQGGADGAVSGNTSRDITKTEAFKRWFGKSRVVDESGEPLVVYHGTPSPETITEFRLPALDSSKDQAIWFTPSKQYAGIYARRGVTPDATSIAVGAQKKKILPVYLSIQNPLDLRNDAASAKFREALKGERGEGGKSRVQVAKDMGYDGIITSLGEYLAFSPTQIKSIHNSGAFDPDNPAILGNAPADDGGRRPAGDPMADLFDSVASTPEDRAALEGLAGNINLRYIAESDDIKDILTDVAKRSDGFINARRGVVPNEQTRLLASELGMSYSELMKRQQGDAFNAESIFAARVLLIKSAKRMASLAQQARRSGSMADLIEFHKAFTRHAAIQEQVAGMTAEAGRALQQFKMLAGDDYFKAAKTIMDDAKSKKEMGVDAVRELADMVDALNNPAQIGKFTRDAFKVSIFDMLRELWINALLSGIRTQVTNVLSNTVTAMWQVPETAIASAIGRLHAGERVEAGEAFARITGLIEGTKEGLIAAGYALRTGEPADLASKLENHRKKAIPGLAGEIVRTPGRLLMAGDELFKAVNYRAEINALAVRMALKEGWRDDKLSERIAEFRAHPTKAMERAAHEAALYSTFQTQLGPVGRYVMALRDRIPGAFLIMPFIRTPANILKYAAERTPLGFAMQEVRDNMRGLNGKAKRDTQIARMMLGSGIAAALVPLILSGVISGGGPDDDREKNVLRATGWQPYSIKIGDTWYSYQRFDPFALIIGITADAIDVAEAMTEAEFDKIGAIVVSSISSNVLDKTWLRGLSDFFNAVTDKAGYKWDSYIRNLAGTAVPTLMAQTAQTIDPVLRDARTTLDRIKSRVPWLSRSLPPRRNIFGEEIRFNGSLGPDLISPVFTSTETDNPVAEAMLEAKYFPSMPTKTINKHVLTPEQYDRYCELAGKEAVRRLTTIIASSGWANRSVDAKADRIETEYREAREKARAKMKNLYPELKKKVAD